MDTQSKARAHHTIVQQARAWFLAILVVPLVHTVCADESLDWTKSITSGKGPGDFVQPPPMRLTYRFGWSGIQAATCNVHLYSPARDKVEVEATGATAGLARVLFRLDVYHRATESKTTLTPIHFYQEEKYRAETVKTNVDFEPDQVTGLREKIPSDHPPKPNVFKFNSVFDMTTALLWIRSQPLTDGETESLVVWASNAPYLATVNVIGRETLTLNGRKQKTIKLDLKLKGIDKKLGLKEHSVFKSGRGWLSDDDRRIPIRIEADIFIGYVFAELQSLNVD
jgi:Protein of unknown function (DUF3108)